jgi:cytochrome c-type biogenesis protein CcmE
MQLGTRVDRSVVLPIVATAALAITAVTFHALATSRRPPYMFVDELVKSGFDDNEGRYVRVHGWVAARTIEELGERQYRFQLQKNGMRLQVDYRGLLPDTFSDTSEVVVAGRLRHDGVWYFEGTALSGKCGGKYEGLPSNKMAFK